MHSATSHYLSKRNGSSSMSRYCFVFFPMEKTHGIWPERLIRARGRFSFEAKHGNRWYECRIEREGLILLITDHQSLATLL